MIHQRRTFRMLIALACMLAPVTARPVSIDDFVNRPVLRTVKISPDGKHLAMLRREAKDTLFIIKRTDMSVVTGVNSSANQRFIDFTWVNANRILIEPALEVSGFSEPAATGEILGFSLDGRNNGFIKRSVESDGVRMYTLVGVLPKDADHVLVEAHVFAAAGRGPYVQEFDDLALADRVLPVTRTDAGLSAAAERCTDALCRRTDAPTLLKLNVYTGVTELVAKSPVPQGRFVADDTAETVLAFGEPRQGTVASYAKRGNEWSQINEFARGMGIVPIAVRSAQRAWALDNRVDTTGLSELDLRTGAVESHFRDRVSDLEHLVRDYSGANVLAARYTPGYPSWHYVDERSAFAQTHKALRVAFPQSDVDVTSFTADNTEFIVRVYSDRNAGDYYLVNTNTRDSQFLVTSRTSLEPTQLAESKPVQVETRDGFRIHGLFTAPSLPGSAQPPLVVMVHDQPFATRFYWTYDEDVQLLASHGFAVLQINPRGSAGFGRSYRGGSDEALSERMRRDVVDATRAMITQERADQNRVCLYGRGFGGYAAIMALIEGGSVFGCVISYGGLYDLDGQFDTRDLSSHVQDAYLRDRTMADSPWRRSPISEVDQIDVPVMLAHGGLDRVVPIAQARTMQAALTANGTATTAVFEADEPHRFEGPVPRRNLYQETIAFLNAHIEKAPTRSRIESSRPTGGLDAMLSDVQRSALQKVLDDIHAHVVRVTRTRDERNLPSGLTRRPMDYPRVIRQAVDAHDRDARKVLTDEQWPGYEALKQTYSQRLEEAVSKGRSPDRYKLEG